MIPTIAIMATSEVVKTNAAVVLPFLLVVLLMLDLLLCRFFLKLRTIRFRPFEIGCDLFSTFNTICCMSIS